MLVKKWQVWKIREGRRTGEFHRSYYSQENAQADAKKLAILLEGEATVYMPTVYVLEVFEEEIGDE